MINWIMYDDMHQDDVVMMIRMIMCDEYQDDAMDDMNQDDAMTMIRMIMYIRMMYGEYQVDTPWTWIGCARVACNKSWRYGPVVLVM